MEKAIAEWTIQYTKEEAFHILQQKGIASSPVNNLDDVINNPQIQHREMIRTLTIGEMDIPVPGLAIKVQGNSVKEFTLPPTLGEHSEEILVELGFSEEEIEDFIENNIIGVETKKSRYGESNPNL